MDVARLLQDILEHARILSSNSPTSSRVYSAAVEINGAARAGTEDRETKDTLGGYGTQRTPGVSIRNSREEIEAEAAKQGASSG